VRAETRHNLKQDRFSRVTIDAAERTAHWSVEHKNKLIIAAVIVLILAAAAAGSWYFLNQQDQKASLEMTQAVRTLDTPVRPPNMPAQPEAPSFASSAERATAAHKQFQAVVDKYPHTHSAEFARYFLALTAADLGDNASAERELQKVISSADNDVAALAKMALASVYRNTGRSKQAI
jgi:predicted negative regulator of RcsB-dependent stress response